MKRSGEIGCGRVELLGHRYWRTADHRNSMSLLMPDRNMKKQYLSKLTVLIALAFPFDINSAILGLNRTAGFMYDAEAPTPLDPPNLKMVDVNLSSLAFQEIKAPDGVTYTVIKSEQVNKPDAARCGYNDLGVPNFGIFRREYREYSEYKKGKFQRKWRDTVDVFLRCYEP